MVAGHMVDHMAPAARRQGSAREQLDRVSTTPHTNITVVVCFWRRVVSAFVALLTILLPTPVSPYYLFILNMRSLPQLNDWHIATGVYPT